MNADPDPQPCPPLIIFVVRAIIVFTYDETANPEGLANDTNLKLVGPETLARPRTFARHQQPVLQGLYSTKLADI